ncbi:MAG TPA: thioredoxin domain-containing protein, partial [Pontiella sp.]|nr:thioredoxin domain-containing protein [Pontiella sp.]
MNTFTNRLAAEKSPYLLQHAHNPVDWYAWGEEAFEKARQEDKPIFLSIGYATCHWCHVMEHESFENEEIANMMNEAFVCIKVDREERPDIDHIYMTVCQMMTGSGGWPLTILMTPDKKPFHAATYIPPDARFGRIGMKQLIPRISSAWKTRRAEVLASAGQVTEILASQNTQPASARLNAKVLDEGYADLMQQYDERKGGFGQHPKFPTPHKLVFLLRYGQAEGIRAVEHTLKEMRKGGIYDQIGFGFHRYSTDDDWLLPHFEKMLYDQALLAIAYTEAYALTRKPFYREVTEEIFTYILRDMTSPEGGFYSAEDADSAGEEGLFYIWDAKEMESILGEDFAFAAKIWNISPAGNFRDEASGKTTGKNIPHLSAFLDERDAKRLATFRKKLFKVREKRIHPLKDTKILADWNGLMIAALAKAGRAFGEQKYIDAALRANTFIETYMRSDDSRLWHRFRDGHRAVPGQLDDYAFLIFGLLELYESTLDACHLDTAIKYNEILQASFKDAGQGGYFMTASDAEELIVRPKELYDGAIPSGNSVQLLNLLRMARLTGRFELEQQAGDAVKVFGGVVHKTPSAFTQALIAVQFGAGKSTEIVVVGKRGSAATEEMLDYINSVYNPGKVVVFKDPENDALIRRLAPFTRKQGRVNGRT